jgi:hydroxymethylglutaryl-CoA reductase
MNGIDAVVLATGNDFRAVEAEYILMRQNQAKYSGLSHAKIEKMIFTFLARNSSSIRNCRRSNLICTLGKAIFRRAKGNSSRAYAMYVAVAGQLKILPQYAR